MAMDDRIEIIGRSRRPVINMGQIMAAFGGGGHAVAAAASVKHRTMIEVRAQLIRLLTECYRPTLLAQDVMSTPVKTLDAEATMAEAERCLSTAGVSVLPVLGQHDYYRGVICREAVQKALFHGCAHVPVHTFLQTAPYTATPQTPFHDLERQMLARQQRLVPILSGTPPAQKVVGVITRADLLRVLHDDVLTAARARAKGQPSPAMASRSRRQVQHLLRARLSSHRYAMLERVGQVADAQGVVAYAVGGGVRDLLLGLRNPDCGVLVAGDGLALAQALARQEGARVTVSARFGTAVVLLPDGGKVVVATARPEYYEYPTARPITAQNALQHDLYRRDFTINTLAIRLNARGFGELLDFYGGLRDLKDKTLRVVHSESFVDDPTRILRVVRFAVRFGFRLGKETLTLLKGAVNMGLLQQLSGVRLRQELRLLLAEPEARRVVERLAELDLLRFLPAELSWSAQLDHLLKAVDDVLAWYRVAALNWPVHTQPLRGQGNDSVEPWLVRLIALLDALSDTAVRAALPRLSLAEPHTATVLAARAARHLLPRLAQQPAPAETYRLLAGQRLESLLFLLAKATSPAAQQQLAAYLGTYRYIQPQLSGHDLRALGLTPGPQFRTILQRLREARLNGEVTTAGEERALVWQLVGRL
jgi:tRNA nucleotidyltransferase (CCA-adding enzyme)